VMEAFGEFSPEVRRVSIDEAFLRMSGTERLWGPPEAAAAALKARVRERTGLSISVVRAAAALALASIPPDAAEMADSGGRGGCRPQPPMSRSVGPAEASM